MSFGAGGSVLAMIQSLRSNKNLLQGRRNRGYFLRELSDFNKGLLYKTNKRSTSLPISTIKSISWKYIKQKEKANWMVYFLLTFAIVGIVMSFYKIATIQFDGDAKKNKLFKEACFELETHYEDNMVIGRKTLISRDYFFAGGNYQKALKAKPNDIYAEYYSAKSYCKLCRYRNTGCEKAEELVTKLIQKYPRLNSPRRLKRKYLLKDK